VIAHYVIRFHFIKLYIFPLVLFNDGSSLSLSPSSGFALLVASLHPFIHYPHNVFRLIHMSLLGYSVSVVYAAKAITLPIAKF